MRYPDYLVHYNKNHDKRTGRFTFGDGNGDGVSPDDYRTPELDKKYSELEKTGLISFRNKLNEGNKWHNVDEWDDETIKISDIGLKALNPDTFYSWESFYKEQGYISDLFPDINERRKYFAYDEPMTGLMDIAYLASKGYNKDQIFKFIETANDTDNKNQKYYNDFYSANQDKIKRPDGFIDNAKSAAMYERMYKEIPYSGVYELSWHSYRLNKPDEFLDNYIDSCTKISKEMEHSDMDYSDYLMHFNKNHDKKSGRFSFGDGDGDGIRDDHSNQSKKQSTSDGSKKTIMISSPKNPHNPFSGREKTKIEVSDDAYKEFMKSDTKHDIIRGTSNLVSGGLFIAAGVLTENPVALGIGVAHLVGSAANYVDSGTHFVNKIVDSVYKDKPVGEIESLIKVDPSLFGNKKYYDPKTKEIVELSYKEAYERNKAVGYK